MAKVIPPVTSEAVEGRRHVERIARGGFFSLVGAVVSSMAVFAFTVVVTRSVDQTQAGILFALTSAFVIAYSVARLGVPTGLVYSIAGYRADGDQARIRPVILQAVAMVVIVGLVLGVTGVLTAPALARFLTGDDDPATVWLVRLFSAGVVVAAVNDVAVGVTRGFGIMRALVMVDRLGRPITQFTLAVLAVALLPPSALSLGMAWLFPFIPAAVVVLMWSARLTRAAESRAGVTRAPLISAAREMRAFWRFTAPRSVGSIAQMVLQRADIVLVGVIRGPEEAAVYAAATRFLVLGQMAGGVVSITIQPKIAMLVRRGDMAQARAIYRIATTWLVLISWPVYLTFAIYAPHLLQVFGDNYDAGWPVIVLLSLSMLVATGCGAVDTVLVMAGKASWTMANSLLALLINIGLNLLLIPSFGVIGAAIAWSTAILISNLLPLAQLQLALGMHPFGKNSAGAMALALSCFALLPAAATLVGADLGAVVALSGFGAALYATALWLFREPFQLSALAALRRNRAHGGRGRLNGGV